MASTEKFCLKWNDFHDNIATTYTDIRKTGDFTDVTLACEDDQQVEAHRVILSACSPYFMKVLRKSKHPHPIIYMRGLKAKDLMAIFDFIYQGEATIYQKDLERFLFLAQELQLKGLSECYIEENRKGEEKVVDSIANLTTYKPPTMTSKPKQNSDNISDLISTKLDVYDSSFDINGTVSLENVPELDELINTMMQKLERSNDWDCKVCGKTSKKTSHIRQHIEANHIVGMEHPCDHCGKVSRSKHDIFS